MKTRPGMVRSWPEAIGYGCSMIALSIVSTIIVGWLFGAMAGLFVRAFLATYSLFKGA